jgi:hypothetical protein
MQHESGGFMSQVKTIGRSGQLSLGKEYAGRTVVIDSPEEGVWVIKTARVIPDSELWLHQEPVKSDVEEGLAWAKENPVKATDLDIFEADMRKNWEIEHGESLDE